MSLSRLVNILFAVSAYLYVLTVGAAEEGYIPPFHAGNKFLIVQGFGGKQTHHTQPSLYAVDIAMPEGEPVCAARRGVVVNLNNDGDKRMSQFVHIEHDDKTIGDYEHLQVGSIKVNIGQSVIMGECFAQVGNTGYSTGAHLHFAVLRKQGFFGQLVSQPFMFKGNSGVFVPERLMWIENPVVN